MFDFLISISELALPLAVLISSAVSLLLFLYSRRVIKRDVDFNRMILSESRAYYENQIRDVVERLTAAQDRWEDVNHLLLSGQRSQQVGIQTFDPKEVPIFHDLGLSDDDLTIVPDLVFVLTPVLKSEETAYFAIETACVRSGLRATRGDFVKNAGDILPQIVKNIAKCRIIVANISTRNPNVYYELGIAHALGKATILVSRTIEDVSFNISSKRVITYSKTSELMSKLYGALESAKAGEELGND